MHIWLSRSGFGPYERIDVVLAKDTTSGVLALTQGGEWQCVEDGSMIDPSFRLTSDEAQGLMDRLWTLGLRPTEGAGSAGSLAATERHLADMREIALGALKKAGAV